MSSGFELPRCMRDFRL